MRLSLKFLLPLAALLAGPVHAAADAAPATPALEAVLQKQVYQMTPQEAHLYIAHMRQAEPDLRKRIAAIGRKTIGQPYLLNPLGEYPFELHDTLPMFSLEHSDCVVFVEQTYAMALSRSWEEFFWTLQRIRYKDGVVGVASRNHYTEVDWNPNNRWLVTDISAELGGPDGPSYLFTVDRARFLKERFNITRSIAVQTTREAYVAKDRVAKIAAQLQDGDFVNVISVRNGQTMVTHTGLVVTTPQGERRFLNSAEPQVREETFDAFMARAAAREERATREGRVGLHLAGFKFLRLNVPVEVPAVATSLRPG
jgi:hypothetical protein